MKRAIIAVVLLAVVGGGVGAWYSQRNKTEIQVQAVGLTRGDIIDSVGATGTLQAVTTVQVGSQVSGNIQYLGADFNSIVKKGQVIARLDPSLFDAQMQQTQANLTQARANLTKAQSDLEQRKVGLLDAQQKFARAKELASKELLAASDMDAAKIAVDTATAGVASATATVTQSQAQVVMSEASVNQAQVNRDHTIITAPIDGIVTQRNVDVGQTVAASMQAPTLFIIAADLTEMQVNANIDEADVGRIRPGQTVSFRVDAYPTDNFQGTVTQIRLQPIVVQNVTTYGAVITVPNRELKLKPGMTANVKVEVAKRTNVLRIPNAALRFRPTQDMFAALNQPVPPELTQFANAAGGNGRGGRGGRGGNGPAVAGNDTPSGQQANGPAAQQAGPQANRPTGQQAGAGNNSPRAPRDMNASAPGEGRRGGFGGDGQGSGRGPGNPEFQARMLERFKTMSPDEQQQFLERMKQRGGDTSAFAAAMTKSPASAKATAGKPAKGGATDGGAQTIDALFAPLPQVESRGRAWLYVDTQMKPVNLRLGVTDGTYTEVLSAQELPDTAQVVTGITGVGTTRALPQQQNGNPLMPGRGPGGPGGFGGGGAGRGGRG